MHANTVLCGEEQEVFNLCEDIVGKMPIGSPCFLLAGSFFGQICFIFMGLHAATSGDIAKNVSIVFTFYLDISENVSL
jgi:hypothetical protein